MKTTLRKKQIEILLSQLEKIQRPNVKHEQYQTTPEIASFLIFTAFNHGDIKGKKVCDLGCGSGILGIGAALLGAREVTAIDIDKTAIKIARRNVKRLGLENVELIAGDINCISGNFDTVIQNPPFGIQKKHADRKFLEKAMEIARVVYSIHKGEEDVRAFLKKLVQERQFTISFIIREKMSIPYQFSFHKRPIYQVNIDLYRIVKMDYVNVQSG